MRVIDSKGSKVIQLKKTKEIVTQTRPDEQFDFFLSQKGNGVIIELVDKRKP